jgi:hypothetical protein
VVAIVLAVVGVIFIAVGLVYIVRASGDLPTFVPGYIKHATKHRVKRGTALVIVGAVALVAAWWTTRVQTHEPT